MVSSTKKPDPSGLLRVMERDEVPQRTVAALAGLSEGAFSAILSGRPASTETKLFIFAVLKFCRDLRRSTPAPVDFRKVAEIKELWLRAQREEMERTVIRQASELQLDAPVAAE